MVMKKIDNAQSKLGIRTYDFNVLSNHIARFVVDFIEESYPHLGIEENDEKEGRSSFPPCSILKLLVYSKIDHVESARIIADMAKYHDIYKFVCDGFTPSERTIQRYRVKYGKYYEILLQKTLEKASELDFTKFNHVAIDGTIIKAHNSNQNMISKKRNTFTNPILQRNYS